MGGHGQLTKPHSQALGLQEGEEEGRTGHQQTKHLYRGQREGGGGRGHQRRGTLYSYHEGLDGGMVGESSIC